MSAAFRNPLRRGAAAAGWLLLAVTSLLIAARVADASAQGPSAARAPSVKEESEPAQVEVEPLRCWWRTSTGSVALGEPFDVRLTCSVLETDTVQVVPDEARLAVAAAPFKPFEVIGGEHPADTRAGRRRFFQYRYRLRLTDAEAIGQDVSLPRLLLTYKVQSRVAADATLVGRDFTYLMPGLTVRMVSQVPVDATDIRDGADVGLERIDALEFRARLLNIGSIVSLAGAVLLGVLALTAGLAGARRTTPHQPVRVAEQRVLAAASTELSRVARQADGGWTPELVRAGHAALRIVAAMALGKGVSEQPLAPDAQPVDGRIAVRSTFPWRPGVAITSPVTPGDFGRPPDGSGSHRQVELNAMRDALAVFTAVQFASGGAPADPIALGGAIEAGRVEAARLLRQRRWRFWPRHGR